MTKRVAIGVMAEPPLPGRCLSRLLAAHAPEWTAGLYAAMLRDTLDGLQSIDADDYLVFATADDETTRTLARHVPAPWQIVGGSDPATALVQLSGRDGIAILARSDAPSAFVDRLVERIATAGDEPFAVLGPSELGNAWLVGASEADALGHDLPWGTNELVATIRLRCAKAGVTLHELPTANIVDEPSAVLTLLEELRRHPERAPRTAQYVVTHA